jgi:hypothetical protein
MSKSVIEQGLNFYIKQMEDFIKKIEIKKWMIYQIFLI